MKTVRLIIAVLLLIAFAVLIYQDNRYDITCEAVYIEHDTVLKYEYIMYWNDSVDQFIIKPVPK